MWNRVDLKARGKEAFRKNYWASVAVALLSGLVTTVSTSSGRNAVDTGSSTSGYAHYYGGNMFSSLFAGVLTATLVVLGIFLVVLRIFIGNLLEIGGCRFFLANQQEQPRVSKMFEVFKGGNYGNQVLTMFLMNLYVFLWSLLLIVPGIIKGYEYRMVPYILAENPDMSREEVFERLNEVFRDVFDEEDITVDEGTTAEDIDGWDSLEHINLMAAVESEFGIKFSMGQIVTMKNVGEMADIILQKV